jgi:transcriptional regulator, XRE family
MAISGLKERFATIRQKNGLNIKQFAQSLDMEPTTVSSIESGKREPSKEVLYNLAVKYAVSLNWIFTGEGEMLISSHTQNLPILDQNNSEAKIPLLRQKVSCGPGQDWESENNIIDYIDVFNISRLKIKRLFALKVEGSSMIGAGIHSGDCVLFDGTIDQRVRDGLYVFALDGEVFCKRLEFDMNKIRIYSVRHIDLDKAELMRTLDTQDMNTAERLTIFGRVLYWIHPYDDSLHRA